MADPSLFSRYYSTSPPASLNSFAIFRAEVIMKGQSLVALHINAGNLYGGIETLLYAIAKLRNTTPTVEPQFAVFFEGRHSEELRSTQASVYHIGNTKVSRPWTILMARNKLRQLLATACIDVIVTHGCWNHAIAAPVARKQGIPIVFWAHGIQSGKHWVEKWAKRLKPNFVLSNSQTTRTSVVSTLFPDVANEVMYLPVIPTITNSRTEVRTALGTPNNKVVILMACRMEPWKGHQVLINALGKMREELIWECWIVGGAQTVLESEYENSIRKQAKMLGIAHRVRFLGQRNDVQQLMSAADVYCQPNTSPEPFGIAFIEAMYARLPIITSRIGGALEIVDETCGVLLEANSIDLLVDSLHRLSQNSEERNKLGIAAAQRAQLLCDPANRLSDLANYLHSVICNN